MIDICRLKIFKHNKEIRIKNGVNIGVKTKIKNEENKMERRYEWRMGKDCKPDVGKVGGHKAKLYKHDRTTCSLKDCGISVNMRCATIDAKN